MYKCAIILGKTKRKSTDAFWLRVDWHLFLMLHFKVSVTPTLPMSRVLTHTDQQFLHQYMKLQSSFIPLSFNKCALSRWSLQMILEGIVPILQLTTQKSNTACLLLHKRSVLQGHRAGRASSVSSPELATRTATGDCGLRDEEHRQGREDQAMCRSSKLNAGYRVRTNPEKRLSAKLTERGRVTHLLTKVYVSATCPKLIKLICKPTLRIAHQHLSEPRHLLQSTQMETVFKTVTTELLATARHHSTWPIIPAHCGDRHEDY